MPLQPLRARDRSGPPLALQVLVCPVVDHDMTTVSYRERGTGPDLFITAKDMEWFWDLYLADPAARAAPDASPLRAERLSNLPPGDRDHRRIRPAPRRRDRVRTSAVRGGRSRHPPSLRGHVPRVLLVCEPDRHGQPGRRAGRRADPGPARPPRYQAPESGRCCARRPRAVRAVAGLSSAHHTTRRGHRCPGARSCRPRARKPRK